MESIKTKPNYCDFKNFGFADVHPVEVLGTITVAFFSFKGDV